MDPDEARAKLKEIECFFRDSLLPNAAYRGTVQFNVDIGNKEYMVLAVRIGGDPPTIETWPSAPPDGVTTCIVDTNLEDFIKVYIGVGTAEIARLCVSGRIYVRWFRFRDLQSFAAAFDYSTTNWLEFYKRQGMREEFDALLETALREGPRDTDGNVLEGVTLPSWAGDGEVSPEDGGVASLEAPAAAPTTPPSQLAPGWLCAYLFRTDPHASVGEMLCLTRYNNPYSPLHPMRAMIEQYPRLAAVLRDQVNALFPVKHVLPLALWSVVPADVRGGSLLRAADTSLPVVSFPPPLMPAPVEAPADGAPATEDAPEPLPADEGSVMSFGDNASVVLPIVLPPAASVSVPFVLGATAIAPFVPSNVLQPEPEEGQPSLEPAASEALPPSCPPEVCQLSEAEFGCSLLVWSWLNRSHDTPGLRRRTFEAAEVANAVVTGAVDHPLAPTLEVPKVDNFVGDLTALPSAPKLTVQYFARLSLRGMTRVLARVGDSERFGLELPKRDPEPDPMAPVAATPTTLPPIAPAPAVEDSTVAPPTSAPSTSALDEAYVMVEKPLAGGAGARGGAADVPLVSPTVEPPVEKPGYWAGVWSRLRFRTHSHIPFPRPFTMPNTMQTSDEASMGKEAKKLARRLLEPPPPKPTPSREEPLLEQRRKPFSQGKGRATSDRY